MKFSIVKAIKIRPEFLAKIQTLSYTNYGKQIETSMCLMQTYSIYPYFRDLST